MPLQLEDLAFTRDGIVRLIHLVDSEDREEKPKAEWAELWPFGAVRYRHTKNGYDRVVPLSSEQADILQAYLINREAMLQAAGVTSDFLFPDPRREQMTSDGELLVVHSEIPRKLARECDARGRDLASAEGKSVAVIFGGNGEIIYGFRHTVKTAREELGWQYNKNVWYIGDWSLRSEKVAEDSYSKLNPRAMQAIVDGKSLLDHLADEQESGRTDKVKRCLSLAGLVPPRPK
jgi:integrase